jgi:hypothetical protein
MKSKIFYFFTFTLCISASLFAQKKEIKKAPKILPNSVDVRKTEFPELTSEVKSGKMADDYTITAIDGSFVLKAGQPFKPKKYTNGYANPKNSEFTRVFKKSEGTKVRIDYGYEIDDPNQEKKKDEPIKKIKKTGQLYGIIEFNKVWNECSDLPTTRAYFIDIPKTTIDEAKGGNISVHYDLYTCAPIFPDEKPQKTVYTSFVIWLSDIEF